MAQGTGVNHDIVRRQLTALEDLVALLDRHLPGLDSVIGRQSTAMWTDIPTCSGFGSAYSVELAKVQRGLLGVRWRLVGLQETLAENAASLARVDQDIQDRLDALAQRITQINTPRSQDLLDLTAEAPGDPADAPEPATTPALPVSAPTESGGNW